MQMSDVVAVAGGGGLLSPARTWYAVVTYCAVVGAVLATRPAFAFHEDGSPRDFGCSPGRSVFSLGTVTAASAVASGFAFAVADLASAFQ